jgi:hypothetical protein
MSHFKDGPADGKTLSLSNAPLFLRVVIDEKSNVDALDGPGDSPRPGETVHVYRRVGDVTTGFIDGRDPKTGKRFGRRFAAANYVHFTGCTLDRDGLSDSKKWEEWMIREIGGGL